MIDGYFGVIVPSRQWWGGYFLSDEARPLAKNYLEKMRGDRDVHAEFGGDPFPGIIEPGSPVPAFKGYVAALGSAVGRLARDGGTTPDMRLVVLARAFAEITGLRYFAIISDPLPQGGDSDPLPQGGEMTKLEHWPNARSVGDGRRMLDTHPLVMEYKRAMFEREFARVAPVAGNA